MVILGISGSLRAASINNTLLAAAALCCPPVVTFSLYEGVGALPAFNPDLDDPARIPPAAAAWRRQVAGAAGLVISSPEYAHGIPGSLKNALDWLVGDSDFAGTPVALWNASPGSLHAPAQLREVLMTMSATLVDAACLTLPLKGVKLDAAGIAAHPDFGPALSGALAVLAACPRPQVMA